MTSERMAQRMRAFAEMIDILRGDLEDYADESSLDLAGLIDQLDQCQSDAHQMAEQVEKE